MSTFWTYSPNEAVKSAHTIPHVYSNGQMNSNPVFSADTSQFTASAIQGSTGYFPSLFTVPFILLALGLISIFFMDLCFLLRCCCRCLKCGPTEDMINTDPLKVVKKRKFIWYWFLFWVAIVILADHALFFGNADLDKAIDSGASAMGKLAGMFGDIKNYMSTQGDAWSAYKTLATNSHHNAASGSLAEGACAALMTASDAGGTASTTISGLVGTLPDTINKVCTSTFVACFQFNLVIISILTLSFTTSPLFSLKPHSTRATSELTPRTTRLESFGCFML